MSTATPPVVYEIKSADLPVVALMLKSPHLPTLAQALHRQFAEAPGFFEQDPLLIDLDGLPSDAPTPDFAGLCSLLAQHGLRALAVKSKQNAWLQAAQQAGLVPANDARIRKVAQAQQQTAPQAPAQSPGQPPAQTPAAAPNKPDADGAGAAAPALAALPALVWDKALRSGQQVYAKGRDLIVLGMVNPGAEVIADGHIHIYAPLRGRAIAGARGQASARIFAQGMDPQLISIAGVYRTSENPLPEAVRGKSAQVCLHSGPEGDKLLITPLSS